MRVKLAIFDYDNTLVDTTKSFYESFISSLIFYGLEPISYDRFLHFFTSNNLDQHLPQYIDREEFWETFLRTYELASYTPKPSPKVFSILSELRVRGIKLAIITGRKQSIGRFIEELKRASLAKYFDYIYTTLDFRESYFTFSKVNAIKHVLMQAKVNARQAIMVGDYQSDIISARKAGVIPIGLVDHMPKDGLCRAGAIYVINKLEDLLVLLNDPLPFRCRK
ncbi:MAG TPA: hypothetical protein ENJ59_02650 [Thermofilum sp.]|nr:hypothetical protein [Thermofilum sp.]